MLLNRLFTTGSLRPEDMTRFVQAGSVEGSDAATLIAPVEWSLEASDAFRNALQPSIPAEREAVEENTMPSWLWRRRAKGSKTTAEKSVTDVFDRIAGAAAYRGWKLGLWDNEVEASVFYDEIRAILLTRRLVIAPEDMAKLGADWAYGLQPKADHKTMLCSAPEGTLVLQNETIDSILRKSHPLAHNKWDRFCETSQARASCRAVFADTVAEWDTIPCPQCAPRAMLNLLAFRQSDGAVDVTGLMQATRLAVLLLDLHYESLGSLKDTTRPLAIGFGNLAALLMSIALPFDSEAARATAACIASIMTSTATQTSAYMASKLGACEGFVTHREAALRTARNRLRSAYNEENDYERLSIRPQGIGIESGVDLVLIAAARYAAEEAAQAVAETGLRHLQVTTLFTANDIAPLIDSSSQGIEPDATLVRDYALGSETFESRIHPALLLGLEKMGYDEADRRAVIDHVMGYQTLLAAPGISLAALRDKGFDEATLDKIQKALPKAAHIRQVFTPWILGLDFCRKKLGISAKDLANPAFDFLRHIGFTSREIEAASAFCCGHRTVRDVKELPETDQRIFATREDLSPESMIKMAAAVQSFVSGEVGLVLSMPASVVAQARGELFILAWRLGLKSIRIHREGMPLAEATKPTHHGIIRRKTKGIAGKTVAMSRKKRAPLMTPTRSHAKSNALLGAKSKSSKTSSKQRGKMG